MMMSAICGRLITFTGSKPTESDGVSDTGFVPVVDHPSFRTCAPLVGEFRRDLVSRQTGTGIGSGFLYVPPFVQAEAQTMRAILLASATATSL